MPTDTQGPSSKESTDRSGGIDVNAKRVDVDGDVVGRDKVTVINQLSPKTILFLVGIAALVLAFVIVLIVAARLPTSVQVLVNDPNSAPGAVIIPTAPSPVIVHSPTPTASDTATSTATETASPTESNTPEPSATDTPLPPTSAASNTAIPTATSASTTKTPLVISAAPQPIPTNPPASPLPPTDTSTSTYTPMPTFTYTPTSTNTPTATTPPPCPLLEIFPQAWSCEAYFRFPDPPGSTIQNAFVDSQYCVHTGVYGLLLTYANTGSTSSGWGVQWTGSAAGHLDVVGFSQFKFWVKGQVGHETFQIGLKDTFGTEIKVESVNLIVVSAEPWKQVSVSLSSFVGVNLSSIDNVNFGFNASHDSGTICIDDMQFAP